MKHFTSKSLWKQILIEVVARNFEWKWSKYKDPVTTCQQSTSKKLIIRPFLFFHAFVVSHIMFCFRKKYRNQKSSYCKTLKNMRYKNRFTNAYLPENAKTQADWLLHALLDFYYSFIIDRVHIIQTSWMLEFMLIYTQLFPYNFEVTRIFLSERSGWAHERMRV